MSWRNLGTALKDFVCSGILFSVGANISWSVQGLFLGMESGFGGSLECWDPSGQWEKLGMLLGDESPWVVCRWIIKITGGHQSWNPFEKPKLGSRGLVWCGKRKFLGFFSLVAAILTPHRDLEEEMAMEN